MIRHMTLQVPASPAAKKKAGAGSGSEALWASPAPKKLAVRGCVVVLPPSVGSRLFAVLGHPRAVLFLVFRLRPMYVFVL